MSAPAASAFWPRSATPPTIRRCRAALDYLRREQEADGSWFGRWGTNYIYGTWSVLAALNAAGIDPNAPEMRRAVEWLVAQQRADGGWGETGESYWPGAPRGEAPYSTASQTAWALLALMAAGEVDNPAVARGIAYLIATPGPATATGTSRGTRRSGSRACSICAITATAPFSRYGRWRATAACRWPIRGGSHSGCDIAGLNAGKIARRREFPAFGSQWRQPLSHIAGVAERIAARLRPHGQPVRLRADRDLRHRARRRIDRIDDVVDSGRTATAFCRRR